MHSRDLPIPKLYAYIRGQYRFKAPGVCTRLWTDENWIAFIDSYKGWTVKVC